MMRRGSKFAAWLLAAAFCLPALSLADTPTPQTHHKAKAAKKPQLPPPLPSGPRGPVQQVPLDSIPAVAPQVTYLDGQLSIIAPNSTLADILRAVRKQTSAEIDIPSNATERVVTHLGPGPARQVLADLLNGSHFNYVLLGSPQDASILTKVVLVAKTGPDNVANPAAPQQAANAAAPLPAPAPEATEENAADENADDNADQGADMEQVAPPPADQQPQAPGVKTPQQLLQEMQQRQLQMQQQQQQQGNQPGQPGGYPPPPGAQVPPQPPQSPQN